MRQRDRDRERMRHTHRDREADWQINGQPLSHTIETNNQTHTQNESEKQTVRKLGTATENDHFRPASAPSATRRHRGDCTS